MKKTGDPGIYSMHLCPICKGTGREPKCPWGFGVCKECGGFGILRKLSQDEIEGVETQNDVPE